MIIVPYEALFLDEALFLLSQHEEGYSMQIGERLLLRRID